MKLRYREQKEKDNKQWVEGYEHNLSLFYRSLRDELKAINKDKNLQYNNFKTILWLNIVFIGLSIKIIEYNVNIYFIIPFFLLSFLSILFSLVGMLQGKYNAYASVGRPRKLIDLDNDQWVKAQGLLSVIYVTRRAIRYNGINLIRRARWVRYTKYLSMFTLFVLLIMSLSAININKGDNMADKPKTPTTPKVNPAQNIGKRVQGFKTSLDININSESNASQQSKDSNSSKEK